MKTFWKYIMFYITLLWCIGCQKIKGSSKKLNNFWRSRNCETLYLLTMLLTHALSFTFHRWMMTFVDIKFLDTKYIIFSKTSWKNIMFLIDSTFISQILKFFVVTIRFLYNENSRKRYLNNVSKTSRYTYHKNVMKTMLKFSRSKVFDKEKKDQLNFDAKPRNFKTYLKSFLGLIVLWKFLYTVCKIKTHWKCLI